MTQRHIVWFSCGAASAFLAKIMSLSTPKDELVLVYCDLSRDEHPDNARFLADIEKWTGVAVTIVRSTKYGSVRDVFAARRYMAGIKGAPCTVEMKKVPRFAFQRADDIHHFGLTADEGKRIEKFRAANFDLRTEWVLRDGGFTKDDCLRALDVAGIQLPAMYTLGYRNNNCIGCVKATSEAYWRAIRRDFPATFADRAAQSREIGARLVRVKGKRIFLDELPPDTSSLFKPITENVSCGPECGAVKS